MRKNATTAKGEAMPALTRRHFLAATPAAVAVMALPGAAVAATVPEVSYSQEALRHARELAAVMARPDFLPGDWSCTIKSGNADQPIFFKQDFQPTGRPSREILALIEAHRTAWERFDASCNGADRMSPDYAGVEGKRLNARCCRAEMKALNSLLAHRSAAAADQRARAAYLLDDWRIDLATHPGGIKRLLRSLLA